MTDPRRPLPPKVLTFAELRESDGLPSWWAIWRQRRSWRRFAQAQAKADGEAYARLRRGEITGDEFAEIVGLHNRP